MTFAKDFFTSYFTFFKAGSSIFEGVLLIYILFFVYWESFFKWIEFIYPKLDFGEVLILWRTNFDDLVPVLLPDASFELELFVECTIGVFT